MRTLFAKTTASLAQARGKYLTIIMPEALCLHPHPVFETWCSNNRTLEFILTQAKGNKGKMHIPNQEEAVGMWAFPHEYKEKKKDEEAAAAFSWHNLILFINELHLFLMGNDWK